MVEINKQGLSKGNLEIKNNRLAKGQTTMVFGAIQQKPRPAKGTCIKLYGKKASLELNEGFNG